MDVWAGLSIDKGGLKALFSQVLTLFYGTLKYLGVQNANLALHIVRNVEEYIYVYIEIYIYFTIY